MVFGQNLGELPIFWEFAYPDVAVADGLVMVLEEQRELGGVGFVRRASLVPGRAGQHDVVLDQDVVVKNSEARGL